MAIFPLLAAVAAVPFVAHEYRRRGTLGAGHIVIAACFGLYLVALALYVILPLRPVTPDFCQIYGADGSYLSPFRIVDEIRLQTTAADWRSLLGSPAAQQLIGNVVMFVPLGMFVHYLLRRGALTTIAIGAGVSLLIELTQLTGNWTLYPCAYRYFDSADLVANTLGVAFGVALAPLLRLVPGQAKVKDPGSPRPVSWSRRLLGGTCDSALILALGLVALILGGTLLDATRGQFESGSRHEDLLRATCLIWIPGVIVMLGVPLVAGGRTTGQWAVLLRVTRSGGQPPAAGQIVARFLSGPAILIALVGLGIAGIGACWFAAAVVAAAQLGAIVLGEITEDGSAPTRRGCRLSDARPQTKTQSS